VSEVARLAADLLSATGKAAAVMQSVGTHGALQVKRAMQADASRSRHFRMARHISYEQTQAGPLVWEWQVGPEAAGAGNLAPIAYFGGVHGGGGTVRDPQLAADDELPAIKRFMGEALGHLL